MPYTAAAEKIPLWFYSGEDAKIDAHTKKAKMHMDTLIIFLTWKPVKLFHCPISRSQL